ncbi:hypothetical protein A7J71_17955 [Achromobacter insolitus]|uniref:OB-fold protein n=1 Tax=Achromobacter insolitus TaxID=217204 RepID=UPI0007C7FE25|nr:hypothetical protein [Achromobacter insolitus]OAE52855.1 hypothetical protein A7J71_17955 [Achromobacter insolitus]OCZ50660.1 hypothetical protein A7P22_15385 [Achromobacter insolitus]
MQGLALAAIIVGHASAAYAADRVISGFSTGKGHKYQLSALEYKVFESLIQADAIDFAEGRNSIFSARIGIVRVNSDDLTKAYDSNEVAADRSYKGKTLFVTGRIGSIKSGVGGRPYFVLGPHLLAPQARIQKDFTDFAAQAKKGQVVRLVCVGAGATLSMPTLNDCKPARQVAIDEAVNLATYADRVLSGTGTDEFAQQLIAYAIAAADGLNQDSCEGGYGACVKAAFRVMNSAGSEDRMARAQQTLKAAGVQLLD